MNTIALVIGVLGSAVGGTTIYLEKAGFYGSAVYGHPWLTLVVTAVGLLGAILTFLGQRLGPWLCLAVAAAGTFAAFELWEAAGSFFLVTALIGFTHRQQRRQSSSQAG